MWATLTLMSALSLAPAADAGELQLTNARVTYGQFGPTRPDTKFLPGDVYFLNFDIEGLQFRDDGYVRWSIMFELFDPNGKSIKKSVDEEHDLVAIQGGGRLATNVHAFILPDAPPGEYRMDVVVTDPTSKKKAKLTRKYEVAEKGFGVVGLNYSYDVPGAKGPFFPAPAQGCVGQALFVNYALTGFDRNKESKQPSLKIELRMLDEAGKPTVGKPPSLTLPVKDDNLPVEPLLHLYYPLALTKAGKFTVEIKATDLMTKKTSTVSCPLVVQALPK